MKAILEFNLPEDREDFDFAVNGSRYYIVVQEVDSALRNMSKYEDKEMISIEEVRKLIRDIMEDVGVEYE